MKEVVRFARKQQFGAASAACGAALPGAVRGTEVQWNKSTMWLPVPCKDDTHYSGPFPILFT